MGCSFRVLGVGWGERDLVVRHIRKQLIVNPLIAIGHSIRHIRKQLIVNPLTAIGHGSH